MQQRCISRTEHPGRHASLEIQDPLYRMDRRNMVRAQMSDFMHIGMQE